MGQLHNRTHEWIFAATSYQQILSPRGFGAKPQPVEAQPARALHALPYSNLQARCDRERDVLSPSPFVLLFFYMEVLRTHLIPIVAILFKAVWICFVSS